MKPILSRQMEVYAGFLEYADHHTGRVIDALEELGILDDTLIYYIIGDNGASAEGGEFGTFMITTTANGGAELQTLDFWNEHLDKLGGPHAYNHYAYGWAHALCTPYQWTKQVASHYGGTRNGTIVHWPSKISGKGEVRNQWHHVIDVAPTILELADIAEPHTVNGVTQIPMQGVSMAYSFNEADAAERHVTQYFEMMGNRGIYHDGWTACTLHRSPFDLVAVAHDFSADDWELYDTTTDWSQAHDLSKEHPDKLADLVQRWLIEAVRHNVLPMDDRAAERMNPVIARTAEPRRGHHPASLPGHDPAQRERRPEHQEQVPHGHRRDRRPRGRSGRRDRRAGRPHRWLGPARDRRQARLPLQLLRAGLDDHRERGAAAHRLPPGPRRVRLRRRRHRQGRRRDPVRRRQGRRQRPRRADARRCTSPSTRAWTSGWTRACRSFEGYTTPKGEFTGTIAWGQVDLGDDDHSHLIDPEAHLAAAMLHQ